MKIDKKPGLIHFIQSYVVLSIAFFLPLQLYAHNCGTESKANLNLSPTSSIKKSQKVPLSIKTGDPLLKKQSDQKKGHLHKPENSLIEEPTKQKDDSSIRINVEGMVCSFCAQGISKAFEREGPVKSVRINLDDKTVNVKLKRFRKLSDKKINKIINDAGYDIGEIER